MHLAHLARDNNKVEDIMEKWKELVDKIYINRLQCSDEETLQYLPHNVEPFYKDEKLTDVQ